MEKIPTVSLRKRKGKKGTTWYLDYTPPGGERVRKSLGDITKAEAIEIKGNVQRELKERVLGLKSGPRKKIGLKDLFEEYLQGKREELKESTLSRYGNYEDTIIEELLNLKPNLEYDIKLASRSILELLMEEVEKEYSDYTYNGTLTRLKAAFNYAEEEGYIYENPTTRLSKKTIEKDLQQKKFYSEEHLEIIWDALLDHWVDVFKFITLTGLRRGELIHLIWDNVSLAKGDEQIIVDSYSIDEEKVWSPKTDSSKRRIPLSGPAIDIIKQYKGEHSTYVFPSEKGRKLHPNTLENAFKRALEKTDIDFGSIHTLRHTYASHLVIQGVDLYRVKKLMGHGSIETTQIYAHLAPSDMREDVNKIEYLI